MIIRVSILKNGCAVRDGMTIRPDTLLVSWYGGMRALQNRHRTLIIGVDNRAQELHKDYGVPVVDEKSMDKLDEIINSDFSTNIKLPNENIRRFLKQFDECKSN